MYCLCTDVTKRGTYIITIKRETCFMMQLAVNFKLNVFIWSTTSAVVFSQSCSGICSPGALIVIINGKTKFKQPMLREIG